MFSAFYAGFYSLPISGYHHFKWNLRPPFLNHIIINTKCSMRIKTRHWKVIERYKLQPTIDGWMTSDFTSFSTEFQSYQDDGRMIMKDCATEPRLWLKRSLPQVGIEPGIARSVGPRLTHWTTGAPSKQPDLITETPFLTFSSNQAMQVSKITEAGKYR